MAEITAGMVKELREATGLGMMECKKALTETNGDFKEAEELLRIKSGAKASKAAGRVAAEGLVNIFVSAFLHSIMPRPVASRNSFTIPAVISAMTHSLHCSNFNY